MTAPNYHCPLCGVASTLIITPEQAFCTSGDDCPVLTFNPWLPDGGLGQARLLDLSLREEEQ